MITLEPCESSRGEGTVGFESLSVAIDQGRSATLIYPSYASLVNASDVPLTGAAGRACSALLDNLDEYDYTRFDKEEIPSLESTVKDITDPTGLGNLFEGHEVVVLLAGDPHVNATWDSVLANNLIGTYNCLEAARQAEIETFVFASSNHVVGMYEREHAPAIYGPTYDLVLDRQIPVRPDSHYGTSKVYGETMGRQYVETKGWHRRFYALRIGSLRPLNTTTRTVMPSEA